VPSPPQLAPASSVSLVHRTEGGSHDQGFRVRSNRLAGILDGCLRWKVLYDEGRAWAHRGAGRKEGGVEC
jgi:hypothetical protein